MPKIVVCAEKLSRAIFLSPKTFPDLASQVPTQVCICQVVNGQKSTKCDPFNGCTFFSPHASRKYYAPERDNRRITAPYQSASDLDVDELLVDVVPVVTDTESRAMTTSR